MNSDDAVLEAPFTLRSRRRPKDFLPSFFTSKSGHISEYYIDLDDPHKQFGPGDTVSGKVVLDVSRPLGITHVSLSLFGYVEVYKHHSGNKPHTRTNASRTASGRGKRWVSEYYGDGFASLFEDDLVLCGEGRLDPKLYHFRFEIDFPTSLNLPSSIDFERGTISYVVSSTVTRPTNLVSTTSRDRKLVYRERIDVGSIPAPKPRKVTLEPVDRGVKRTSGLKRLASSSNQEQHSLSSHTSTQACANSKAETSSRRLALDRITRNSRSSSPVSPSATSSASVPSAKDSAISSKPCSSPTSQSMRIDDASASLRIITCNVQLGKSGCLPGEIVNLDVSINHTKPIRSLHGVIATLYRQARTDMHPSLPVNARGKGERYEDYYPRSKSGLGGMSLSAAGSSQVWRKDLSQTFAPLYIDPRTLSSEIKVAVRVPDEAFPSIRNAPGEMISFKYYVEIIIDVHGKLAAYTNTFPNVNMTGGQSALANGATVGFSSDLKEQNFTVWGSSCIDTSSIQREKNAVVITNQLIVGTNDSAKARGKRKQAPDHQPVTGGAPEGGNDIAQRQWSYDPDSRNHFETSGSHDEFHEGYESYEENNDCMTDQSYDQGHSYNQVYNESTHNYYDHRDIGMPVPHNTSSLLYPPANEQLTEKQRMQRAEDALLPSRPLDLHDGVTPIPNIGQVPTAPHLPCEGDFDSPQAYLDAVRGLIGYSGQHVQRINVGSLTVEPDRPVPTYSPQGTCANSRVPSYSDGESSNTGFGVGSTVSSYLLDDKHEMERSRLQGLASEPDVRSRPLSVGKALHQVRETNEPSAPPINEVNGVSVGAELSMGSQDFQVTPRHGESVHRANQEVFYSTNALKISHERKSDESDDPVNR